MIILVVEGTLGHVESPGLAHPRKQGEVAGCVCPHKRHVGKEAPGIRAKRRADWTSCVRLLVFAHPHSTVLPETEAGSTKGSCQ